MKESVDKPSLFATVLKINDFLSADSKNEKITGTPSILVSITYHILES